MTSPDPAAEPQRILIPFVRNPKLGEGKTRLARDVGEKTALDLSVACLRVLSARLHALEDVTIWVAYTPEGGLGELPRLMPDQATFFEQRGDNLGERLAHAFSRAFNVNPRTRVAALGADSPLVPVRWIGQAFQSLEKHDAVIGPTTDGGYYLVGMARPLTGIFSDIPWSSERVADVTRSRAAELGLSLAETPEYFDLDTSSDFARLREDLAENSDDPACKPLIDALAGISA